MRNDHTRPDSDWRYILPALGYLWNEKFQPPGHPMSCDQFTTHIAQVTAAIGATVTSITTDICGFVQVHGTHPRPLSAFMRAWVRTARSAWRVGTPVRCEPDTFSDKDSAADFLIGKTRAYTLHCAPAPQGVTFTAYLRPTLRDAPDEGELPYLTELQCWRKFPAWGPGVFTPDGRHYIIADVITHTIAIGEVATGTIVRTWPDDAPTHELDRWPIVRLSADGSRLARVYPHTGINVWDVPSGALLHRLLDAPTACGRCGDASFDPSGRYLAVAGIREKPGGIFDLTTGAWVFRLFGACTSVDWSPDGRYLAACEERNEFTDTLVLRETSRWTVVRQVRFEGGESVRFSPDGARLVATSLWNYSMVMDVPAWSMRCSTPGNSSLYRGYCPVFTPDGAYLLLHTRNSSQVIVDAQSGRLLCRLYTNVWDAVSAVSPDSQWVGLGGFLWAAESGTVQAAIARCAAGEAVEPVPYHLRPPNADRRG
jgi:hypothetical protein